MKDRIGTANFALLRDPLFWHRACELYIGILHFACFLLNSCSSSKLKGHREHAGFGLLRDPLFLAPRMRDVYRNFTFCMFLLNSCSSSKLKGHREHAGFGLLRDPLSSETRGIQPPQGPSLFGSTHAFCLREVCIFC